MESMSSLLRHLDKARSGLESALSKIDPVKEIYPTWTLKHLLNHFAGWDSVVIESLKIFNEGGTPITPAIQGINHYNAQSVALREDLDLEESSREFHQSRQLLKQTIQEMGNDKLFEAFTLPWGGMGTVEDICRIFADHEEKHTAELANLIEKSGSVG